MKKKLLIACAFFIGLCVSAQSSLNHMPKEALQKGYSNMIVSANSNPNSSSLVPNNIWYDDCSDISTWTITNSSTLGVQWAVEYNPAAIPSADVSPIASATAANGYMFVNSDADGGTTDNDGTTISTEFTNATPIDLTNYPNVQLTFEHCFRWWQDTRAVRVSPDNGVTWVEIDEITNNQGYTYANQSSDNPHMSTYDISSVAGGQSEVLVQFYYNDNDYWAWFWAVDDIAISELPDNFIVSSEETFGGWWIGYQTVGGLGQDYTFNPLSQASANPYAFESVIRNGGIGTQSATMHANVSGAGNFSTTSNPLILASGEQDTVAGTSTFTPSSTGLYNIEMWAVADSAGLGNVITYSDTSNKMSMVTDYIYGKDNGTNDGGYWRLNRVFPNPGGFEVSSSYDIYADATLYSVDVNIADWSIPGAEVYIALYEEDISGGNPIPLAQSDNYEITSSDLGNWVNIPFLTPQNLFASTPTYRIAIGANIHPTDTVGVNVSDPGDYYSAQGLNDKDGILSDDGSVGWYTISDIPMLRMNFDPSTAVSISEVKQNIFNVYPNPTSGVFSLELNDNKSYDITIFNSLGQKVYNNVVNSTSMLIDLEKLESGVYTIELQNSDIVYTERIIIE